MPPCPSGNIELVPTSKTPHPQAQARLMLGARTTANDNAKPTALENTAFVLVISKLPKWRDTASCGSQVAFFLVTEFGVDRPQARPASVNLDSDEEPGRRVGWFGKTNRCVDHMKKNRLACPVIPGHDRQDGKHNLELYDD